MIRSDKIYENTPNYHSETYTRVKPGTNESKKTRNIQNGLAHSRFIVCVTPKQRKTFLDSRIMFLVEHVRNSQSTIYLKSHGCVHGFRNEVSLIEGLFRPDAPTSKRRRLYCIKFLIRRGRSECSD